MTAAALRIRRLVVVAFVLFALSMATLGQNILTPNWVANGWSNPNFGPQYSHDGSHLLVCNVGAYNTQQISVYSVSTGQVLAHLEFDGNNGNLTGACLSGNGSVLYYGTDAGRIFSYNISTQGQGLLKVNEAVGNGPRLLTVSHDGKTLGYVVKDLVTSADRVGLYNLSTNAVIKEFDYSNSDTNNETSSFGFCNGDTNVVLDGPTTYDFTGKQLGAVSNYERAVTVSPNEKTLYTVDSDDDLHSYNASNLTTIWKVSAPDYSFPGAVSSDGKAILFPSNDSTHWYVTGLNTANGKQLSDSITATPPQVSGTPYLATAPNTNRLLLGPDYEPSAESWSFNSATGSGTLVGTLFGGLAHNWSSYVLFTSLSDTVGSTATPAVSLDEYHPNSGDLVTIRSESTGAILETLPEGAVVSPDGAYYIYVHGTGVNVYSVSTGSVVASYGEPNSLTTASFWVGTQTIVVSDGYSNAYFLSFNATAGTLTNLESLPLQGDYAVYAVSPDGTKFACGTDSGTIDIYNVQSGKLIGSISKTPSSYDASSFSFGGNNLIGIEEAGTTSNNQFQAVFRVFDVSTSPFKQIREIVFSPTNSNSVADGYLSPDGQTVVMATRSPSTTTDPRIQSTIRLYSVSSGKILEQWNNQFVPDFRFANTFAFSPDSSTIYWTSDGAIVAAPSVTAAPAVTLSFSSASVTGGSAATMTLNLASAAPTGGETFTLSASNAALSPRASVIVPSGQSSVTFGVPSSPVLTNTPVTVSASANGAVAATASVTVLAPAVKSVTPSANALVGPASAVALVVLTGPAPTGFTVAATSSNAAVSLGSPISFTAGLTYALVPLTISAVTTPTTVTVTIGGVSCNVTVLP